MRRIATMVGSALLGVSGAGAFTSSAEDVSFRNDVMAVLSKAGCNTGPCHGNANGKAGFKLSLRGESAELDYTTLVLEQFGRRIDLIEPEQSLILAKPTTQLAHEGGRRFQTTSREYEILRRWIAEGAPDDAAKAPRLEHISVNVTEAVLLEPESDVQLKVEAHFANGIRRDVTELAVYEPAHPIVNISAGGLVRREQFGETTVLVRYLAQQVPVRVLFVPARPDFAWADPPSRNEIDRQIFAKLRRLRMNPSDLCDDSAFVRRVHLDLLGNIPTAEEARSFVYDPAPDKRARLIDRLLERPEFANFWALKWSDLLRNEERLLDRKGVEAFHRWVRQSFLERKPLDQFAREIIAARGSTYEHPEANFYRANRNAVARGEAAAQLFLGTRVQCAQCHNHPFDRWSQDDYYDWMSVFARVNYKVLENRRRDENDSHEFKGEQVVFMASKGEVKNPRLGQAAKPRFLGETERVDASQRDELQQLAEWTTSPANPFFSKVQANRIWFHLMGRGLVDPIDDFRASNPASHPELLEALAADLADHGFDLRALIRSIMNSRTYQLASTPNPTNLEDEINYARALPRRLTAEQLLDAQSAATSVPLAFTGYPSGTRAVQMAGALPERKRDQRKTELDQFLAEFGKPQRLIPSECERSSEPTMGQAFQMMSGPVTSQLIASKENRLDRMLNRKLPPAEMISELFWATLSRPPNATELERCVQALTTADEMRPALEDLLWALLNSKEFLFRY